MSQATVGDDEIYIAMLRDITDRKARRDELKHMALYDALTDLPNRTLLHDRLDHALRACEREKSQLLHLVQQSSRAHDCAGTEQVVHVRIEDAGRDEVQSEGAQVIDDRVAGVVAALKADDQVACLAR